MSPDMERPRRWEPGALKVQAGGPDTPSVRDESDDHGDQRRRDHGDQLTIDDALEEARRRRDEGQQAATYSTDVAWVLAADRAIAELAKSGEEFDAETVRAIVGPPFGSPSAMGGRFTAAAKAGLIVRAGWRQAQRAEARGRDLKTWRGAP